MLNEPSHLDLCCLTFSLSTSHINVFPNDSLFKWKSRQHFWNLAPKGLRKFFHLYTMLKNLPSVSMPPPPPHPHPHAFTIIVDILNMPASVAQLDACPTGDQEVAVLTPTEVGNILSWKLIVKYFLRSFSPFRWFKKGSCQFLAKECVQYWLTT